MRFTAHSLIAGAIVALVGAGTAPAVVVNLTPDVINGGDTATTSFSNADLTLTPFIGATPSTFNGNATRLGIDEAGTNNNAFNDPDTDPNNGNEEKLEFDFVLGAGLTQIEWDFARADGPGPNDGVFISGFTEDPLATFSGTFAVAPPAPVYDDLSGTLSLQVLGANFSGARHAIDFANPAASNGQTLLLSVTDETQAGAQFPILSISYEDDVRVLGDVDGMNGVTIDDFNIILANFFNDGVTRDQGDLTGDGLVSFPDFFQWRDAFPGETAGLAELLFASVPEPTSLTLLLVGGIAATRRRR